MREQIPLGKEGHPGKLLDQLCRGDVFQAGQTAELAIIQSEEEEVNPMKSIKDRRLRNSGLEREVTKLEELLLEWKELVPGSKAIDLRT